MIKKIIVQGINSRDGASEVEDVLYSLMGVVTVNIDDDLKTAVVDAQEDIPDKEIKAMLKDAGYDALSIQNA